MSNDDHRMFFRHPHLLRIGDQVRVRVDPVFPSREKEELLGETGEIAGYPIEYVTRWLAFEFPYLTPGIFLDLKRPYVRFSTGAVRNLDAGSLETVDQDAYRRRLETSLRETEFPNMRKGARVSDLPDLPFWEGDLVRPVPYLAEGRSPKGVPTDSIPGLPDAYAVTYFSFREPGGIIGSLDHPPRYSIGDRFWRTSGGSYHAQELRLIERGNFWRKEHGQEPVFRDLADEALWAMLFREVEALPRARRPPERFYGDPEAYLERLAPEAREQELRKWYGRDLALAAVQAGAADGIRTHRTVADGDRFEWHTVVRFKDRGLGERVRMATLGGFRIPSNDWIDDDEWR